jgi:hypothetical protein
MALLALQLAPWQGTELLATQRPSWLATELLAGQQGAGQASELVKDKRAGWQSRELFGRPATFVVPPATCRKTSELIPKPVRCLACQQNASYAQNCLAC